MTVRILKFNETELYRLLPKNGSFLLAMNRISNFVIYAVSAVILIGDFTLLPYFVASAVPWFASEFLKKRFHRQRPYARFGVNLRTSTKPNRAFPSSHSATALFLFLATVGHSPLAWLFLTVPVLRILSFQHWITDVLAGMLIGAVTFWITATLLP